MLPYALCLGRVTANLQKGIWTLMELLYTCDYSDDSIEYPFVRNFCQKMKCKSQLCTECNGKFYSCNVKAASVVSVGGCDGVQARPGGATQSLRSEAAAGRTYTPVRVHGLWLGGATPA